jgi:hypothetical protein
MSKKQGPRFTGGDHFTGFEKVVHDLMMCNELMGCYGAYQVSFAGGESGLSFGGNQMDMYDKPAYAKIFSDILENATNSDGKIIFQKSEVLSIVGDKDLHLQGKGKTPKMVFGKDLDHVNAALSSAYGINAINAAYLRAIKHHITHVETTIGLMKNSAAKAFYGTDFGKALLFDYHNQYNLNPEGPFVFKYIDGIYNGETRTVVATKEEIVASTDRYDFSDHQRFMRSTLQWAKNSALIENRLNKSLQLLKQYGLCENGPMNLSQVDSPLLTSLCPDGKHHVKAHMVHYQPSAAHPAGLVVPRVEHCAKNPEKTS